MISIGILKIKSYSLKNIISNNQHCQIYPIILHVNKIIQDMKKYVSKEDVDKGLVDPKKPLKDQKQYMTKIQQEQREKNQKKEKREGHKKQRERPDRPKYNWNRRNVTEDTVVPKEPKKVIQKPDKEKFHNQLNVMKKSLDQLYEKKDSLIKEMTFTMRNTNQTKRTGQAAKSKFFGVLKEKNNLRKIFSDDMKNLEARRDGVETEISKNKERIKSMKSPDSFQECSTEELKKRLEKMQNRLRTQNLDKKEEARINQKIAEMKRAMHKSKPQIEVNAEIGRMEDQNNILYNELKNIREQISFKYRQLKDIKSQIREVEEEMNAENIDTTDLRTPEEIKKQYDMKITDVKAEIDNMKSKINNFKDEYFKKLNQYEDYFDLISYIKMVNEEKDKIKARKEEEAIKKKEWEDRQAKRKREFEERQKKREEKKIRDQQRKKEEEEKKQKLKKDREEYINRNPHLEKIENCEMLIEYCNELRPENKQNKVEKREEKDFKPIQELNPKNKQWEKEIKKGAQIIISKKMKDEEEVPKKVKKQKKKKEKQTDQVSGFTHQIEISKRFQEIKLLPPLLHTQIDETIKQIRDRIQLFGKPTEQQIAAYKIKAQKQFDALHGFNREKKGQYQEKRNRNQENQEEQEPADVKERYRGRKFENKSTPLTDKDFPELE